MMPLRAKRTLRAHVAVIAVVMTSAAAAQTPATPPVPRDPAARDERATELRQRGERLVARGDPGSAVWFLREALAIDPGHAAAAVVLADIYLARSEPATAREVTLQTAKRAPAHAALWLRLARACLDLNDRQGATQALRDGLQYTPRDDDLLRMLVVVSLQRGEWLRALSAQRARASDADHDDAPDKAAIEDALRVLVGTSDRARGLRCEMTRAVVRRALSRCAGHPSPTRPL